MTHVATYNPSLFANSRAFRGVACSREIVILGLVLALIQIADGILTGIGINQFGVSAEGNAFIRSMMEAWGYIPALVVIKTFALTVIGMLCMLASIVTWLRSAMKLVIALYLFAAIIPWSMILVHHALS